MSASPRIALATALLLCAATKGRGQSFVDMSLEDLMAIEVRTASMHRQESREAPGSVTVITREDIRRCGYRTLGEALAGVRGFFTTYDHTYTNPGMRGFNLPGDFGTRFIVLVNGHNMAAATDNSVVLFGQDMPVDISLIERIEIVRGPGSALYGSNGVLATINILTRAPEDFGEPLVRTELGTMGERKLQLASALPVGKKGNLLISGSAFYNDGVEHLDIPGLGIAERMDTEKGHHLFANFTWGNWDFLAVSGNRKKLQPLSWVDTVFNDRGTSIEDTRNFAEARYTRADDVGRQFSWRIYLDACRFRTFYRYPQADGVSDVRQETMSDYIGSQATYRFPAPWRGALTVGAEGEVDTRIRQRLFVAYPQRLDIVNINTPDHRFAAFAQQEWALSTRWHWMVGARADAARFGRNSISPRASLIYSPSARTSLKFIAGQAFRNPSPLEMFYTDWVLLLGNAALKSERSTSYEFIAERRFTRNVTASATAYRSTLLDPIEAYMTDLALISYGNAGRINSAGIEMEVAARAESGLSVTASAAFQRTIHQETGFVLPNSPGEMGKLRAYAPLRRDRFGFSLASQWLGKRQTVMGRSVPGVFLADATASVRRIARDYELQFGVRNLLGRRYMDPVGVNPRIDMLNALGRNAFLALNWTPGAR